MRSAIEVDKYNHHYHHYSFLELQTRGAPTVTAATEAIDIVRYTPSSLTTSTITTSTLTCLFLHAGLAAGQSVSGPQPKFGPQRPNNYPLLEQCQLSE